MVSIVVRLFRSCTTNMRQSCNHQTLIAKLVSNSEGGENGDAMASIVVRLFRS